MSLTPDEEERERAKYLEAAARRYAPPTKTGRIIIGDIVRLRSGSHEMLVVDAWPSDTKVTVAYRVRMPSGRIKVRERRLERGELLRVKRGRA